MVAIYLSFTLQVHPDISVNILLPNLPGESIVISHQSFASLCPETPRRFNRPKRGSSGIHQEYGRSPTF
jgi:hypothetical protein